MARTGMGGFARVLQRFGCAGSSGEACFGSAMTEASILLVDDDPALTDLLAMVLGARGFAVECVADGELALAVVERSSRPTT